MRIKSALISSIAALTLLINEGCTTDPMELRLQKGPVTVEGVLGVVSLKEEGTLFLSVGYGKTVENRYLDLSITTYGLSRYKKNGFKKEKHETFYLDANDAYALKDRLRVGNKIKIVLEKDQRRKFYWPYVFAKTPFVIDYDQVKKINDKNFEHPNSFMNYLRYRFN